MVKILRATRFGVPPFRKKCERMGHPQGALTHARADFTSVREKSWPLNKSGSPLDFASA
jgi:hypothetical protein